MKTGKSLQQLAAEIERQAESKQDYLSDTRELSLDHDLKLRIGGTANNDFQDAVGRFQPTETTHRQIAERVKIPAKYYERMRQDSPSLLRDNVNHWFAEEPSRRMIRTLDGNARAFLSDRYQRIDNYDVANVALPIMLEEADKANMEIVSCEITERKMYIKAVTPRIQGEVAVGDIVQAGIQITNSEIGFGKAVVTPLMYRLWCLNGCTVNDAQFARSHIGARADIGDALYGLLSDEALEADDNAILLKMRDVVRGAFNEEVFNGWLAKMRETTEHKIEGNPVKAVEVLGNKLGITQGESEGVLRHLIEGANLTQYGLLNAVTRYSQDIESYDRASDFEAMGGKVLSLPANDWKEVAQAA